MGSGVADAPLYPQARLWKHALIVCRGGDMATLAVNRPQRARKKNSMYQDFIDSEEEDEDLYVSESEPEPEDDSDSDY